MANKEKQANFIHNCMQIKSPRKYRRQGDNVRSHNCQYNLCYNSKTIPVCKKFCNTTLGISNNVTATVAKRVSGEGIFQDSKIV